MSNLRPVSLLPLPGKLIEKIVHTRLYTFFEENSVLDEKQGGFRRGHCTTATTAKRTEDLYQSINNKELTVATFMDLRKAFDTVDHTILLSKLDKLGVKGLPHNWLSSYLNNRTQATIANNSMSNQLSIHCGVPQGSILGPLLFLVYINDLGRVLESCRFQLYADDTVIYLSGNNTLTTVAKIQEDITRLYEWCSRNRLTINIQKTKAMIIGSKSLIKKCNPPSIKLGTNIIEYVKSYKYLGITLDQTLTFNNHINRLIQTLSHKAYQLAKIRRYINEETSLKIYKAMIIPYLDYGDIIYDAAPLKQLEKLQKIQNRCLRTCKAGQSTPSTAELHARYKVGYLKSRRQAHLKNFMFKQQSNSNLIDNRNIPTFQVLCTKGLSCGIIFPMNKEIYLCLPISNTFRKEKC